MHIQQRNEKMILTPTKAKKAAVKGLGSPLFPFSAALVFYLQLRTMVCNSESIKYYLYY